MQNFKFDIQRFDDSSSSFGILATLNNVLIALRLNELATDFKDNPIGYLKKNANPILKFIGTYLEDITGGKSNEKSKIKSFASILVSGISIIDSAVKISNYAKEKETHAIEISRESELIISELANITNEIVKLSTGEKSFILSITASAISLVANGISTLDGVTDAEKDKINAQYLGFIKVLNKDIVKKLFNAAIDSELNKIDLDDVAKNLDILKNTTILDNISDTLTKTGGVLDLIFAAVEGVQNGIKKYQDTFKKYIEDGIPEDIAKRDAFINAFTAVIHDTAHAYSKGFDDVAYNGIKTLIWAFTGKEGIKGNYVEVMTEMLKVFNYTNTGDAENNYLLSFENNSMVYGYDGNDYIVNMYSNVSLFGGHDDDTIVSQLGLGDDHSTTTANSILGGPGKDLIMAYDNNSTILGGDDIDRIGIFGTKNKIYGGNDTDAILLKDGANDNTINGGLGDDVISLENVKNAVIEYSEGDGNDLILGYNEDDIILINGNYSTQTNEQDVIIVVDNDSITLSGASGKNININNKRSVIGEEQEGNTNTFIPMPSFWYPEVKEIRGTNGDDNIDNSKNSNVMIHGLGGNDDIWNSIEDVSIDSGTGNDTITNQSYYTYYGFSMYEDTPNEASRVYINGNLGDDYIINRHDSVRDRVSGRTSSANAKNVTIYGGDGNDTIKDEGMYSVIDGGGGNDSISNILFTSTSIEGGSGDDTIQNVGYSSSINGGKGNDYITNSGLDSTIDSGTGNDTITNNTRASINGGEDDDIISSESGLVCGGEGNDSIKSIGGYETTIDGGEGNDEIHNISLSGGTFYINSGSGNDSIENEGNDITINGNTGNDFIENYGDIGIINGGEDDDTIINGRKIYIRNTYEIEGNNVVVDGGVGNDSIKNEGDNTTIYGGDGNDSIENEGNDIIINGGTGDDLIYCGDSSYRRMNSLIQYKLGDGNDTIYGLHKNSTLSISDEKYSSLLSGEDLILTVGDEKITIVDAYLSYLSIIGTYSSISGGSIDTTPADSKILIIDSTDSDVTLSSEVETADATKRTKSIQITGNDLDNSIIGGKGSDTICGNSGKNTLTGGKGKNIFVHSGGNDIITDYEKGKDKISLENALIFDFTVDNKKLILAFDDNTSLILNNMANKQISFLLDSKTNKIIFTENASLDGSGKDATLTSNATEFSALNYSKLKNINAESVSSAVNITGNSKANRIIAGNNGSTLNGGKGKDTLFGGNGTDIFVYNNKSGNKIIQNYSPDDIISLTGAQITDAYVKSNDVILKAGSKKITVKDAASKDIIINEDDTTKFFSAGIIYNQDETSAVITKKFTYKSEKVFDNTVTEIDASNAIKKLVLTSSNTTGTTIYGGRNKDSLTGNSGNDFIYGDKGKDSLYGSAGNDSLIGDKGNDKLFGGTGADSLWGGKGNDTLYGDDGSDTFLYSKGDGKDVIFNFSDDDLLQVSGTFSAYYNSNKNEVSFKVASTSNAITLKDFSASSFNVNGNSYKISGDTLIKK